MRIDYQNRLMVRDIALEYVKRFCYLGVYLDSEMSLSPFLSQKLYQKSGKI